MTGIFTLDAVIALILTTIVLTTSLAAVRQDKYPGNEYIYQLSVDSLAIMEAQGALGKLAEGDESGYDEIRSILPQKLCIEVQVINSTGIITHQIASHCSEPVDYAISRRSFISDGRFYIASAKVWFK
ncbi:hypothetical protein ACFLRF_06255 [Candidatus Altiarchaeota archaeon]